MQTTKKKVIAVDIDDVLAANAEGFTAFSNEHYGTTLQPADYHEHWAELWKTDLAETERRSAELHDSGIIASYRHDNQALPVLAGLHQGYSLIIITSRRSSVEKLTRQWVRKHYGELFDDIKFAGIFETPFESDVFTRTKADLFSSNQVSYVIDDQLKHCLAGAELGIEAILFGDYPWNSSVTTLPENVTRCRDWPAVKEYFDARQ
ncbi:MAG: hypothetical protein ABI602_04900 [Candidatus Saccharibacteria bacterium]